MLPNATSYPDSNASSKYRLINELQNVIEQNEDEIINDTNRDIFSEVMSEP